MRGASALRYVMMSCGGWITSGGHARHGDQPEQSTSKSARDRMRQRHLVPPTQNERKDLRRLKWFFLGQPNSTEAATDQ